MHRRDLLTGMASLAALRGSLAPQPAGATAKAGLQRVRPGMPGWPSQADWAALDRAVEHRLTPVMSPDFTDPAVRKLLGDPYYILNQSGLTQSSGWLDAWRSVPSRYVVNAESAADVAATMRFAQSHRLRLVIKGCGHSYLGTSDAPDSLLIRTRKMDAITVHDGFTPAGTDAAPVAAVSLGAGCTWLQAYQAVTTDAGRYVQGGGGLTVGVAGLVLGGGFGSFSKGFGTAGASLLEAEIITADGAIRTVNAAREPDLFWALKGGGGGTFGVTTRFTLATHPLPQSFGVVHLTLRARSDAAYRRLLARFLAFYAANLANPHWGEQVHARPENRLDIAMTFQGLTAQQARAAWQPLIDFVQSNAADYTGLETLAVAAVPAREFWNGAFLRRFAPSVVRFDFQPGAAANDFWWQGDGRQAGAFLYAYESAWLPSALLLPSNQALLAAAWFAASRHWPVGLHFNKGLAGASADVIKAARDTPMNPDVLDAFALAIIGAEGPPAFPGFPAPDPSAGTDHRQRVRAAMRALRAVAPDTGAYVNECDYFQPSWQTAFWGPNYARLSRIKQHYDPAGLFFVHHGVGSEDWSSDGFIRTQQARNLE